MKPELVEPGSLLGVLGGGQLGSMFAAAARRMGYQIAVWDPDPDAPAHRLARHSFPQPFTDREVLEEFSRLVSVVTYEWENVPAALCRELGERKPVRPSSAILNVIQDRVEQKTFLSERGYPVSRFAAVSSAEQLGETVRQLGYPAVCKTATAGYDGKGQWWIRSESDVQQVQRAVTESIRHRAKWIVESHVPFDRELSVLIARGTDGTCVVYPPAENEHEDGILRTTVVPADIPAAVAARAGKLAREILQQLDGIGVFCIELFQLPGEDLLINEIAPRPHNSAHYTLDACTVSQFEQQVRAICGLPLGEVRLLSPAVMVNLIGDDAIKVMRAEGCRALMAVPGAVLHLYGKRAIRPRRKMGHVTFLAERAATARDRATELRHRLRSEATV